MARFIRLFLILALLVPLVPAPASADVFTIGMRSRVGPLRLQGEEIRKHIWVEFGKMARSYGAKMLQKKDVYLFIFPTYQLAINVRESRYSILENGDNRWINKSFSKRPFTDRDRVMVPMDDIPNLLRTSFDYHLQRHNLTEILKEKGEEGANNRRVKLSIKIRQGRVWIPVQELAEVLGIVTYSSGANKYSLVMPDFSVLVLQVGEQSITRRNQAYIRLDDPVILVSGSPYVSFRSVNPLFGIDIGYDDETRSVIIPQKYGRLREIKELAQYRMVYSGYKPNPFKLSLDEFTAYYQNPAPSYQAEHARIYESVRDLFTNEPIDPGGNDMDRLGGEALASVSGDLMGRPFAGKGLFEKVGGTGRVVNGSLGYGHPGLHVEGGREFLIFNDLNNQFAVVDQVELSHSSDIYGEGEKDSEFKVRAGYGQHDFSVFISTDIFSQSVKFKQSFVKGGFGFNHNLSERQKISFSADAYAFRNEVKNVESVFTYYDFFKDLFGDDFVISIDPADEEALIKTQLSDRHLTSILEGRYEFRGGIELSGVYGSSYYKDDTPDEEAHTDEDWQVRSILRRGKSRLDLQYEESGDNYRSIGDPTRYRARKIYRVAPYLDIARPWKIFGQVRKEYSESLVDQGVDPFSTRYVSVVNLFNFKKNVIRASVNDFDATLYGRRTNGALDFTQYIGRDSWDIGSTLSAQRDIRDQITKQSYSGRMTYTFLRKDWKLSIGEEYTRHHYPFFDIDRYESISSLLLQIKKFKALAQYEIKPKSFLLEERLHTGVLRMGRKIDNRRYFNLFYAASSLRANLSDPEVWRAGLELVQDF